MTRRMILLSVVAGVALGFALWPDASDARKCTGPGFKCNAPEGCELATQMMLKWAYRAVFADDALAAKARQAAEAAIRKRGIRYPDPGITEKEWQSMVDREAGAILENAAAEGASSLRLPACKGSKVADPPGMSTEPPGPGDRDQTKCKVVAHVGNTDVPPEQAYQKVPNACDEMIDASRVHEGYHVAHCNPRTSTVGLDETRKQEVAAYTLEIHYLRDEMAAVGHWCTPSRKRRAGFTAKAKRATRSALAHQIGGR